MKKTDYNFKLEKDNKRRESICAEHFNDYAIQDFINDSGKRQKCNYCKRVRNCLDLDAVAEFIEKGLKRFYDDAANWLGYDSGEGGYLGETFDAYEIITSELELVDDEPLISDLGYLLADWAWCRYDPYGDSESEGLLFDWTDFKNAIKHQYRYTIFFQKKLKQFQYKVNIADVLLEIGERIVRFDLFTIINADTIFYRCRQHEKTVSVTKIGDIIAAPDDNATLSNRMSPAGISMFYGSFNSYTSEIETLNTSDTIRTQYSTGIFRNVSSFKVVDFTKLPSVPSIFDEERRNDYHSLCLLWNFVHDLSKPIAHDGKEHIEYIPTQVITEYIHFMMTGHEEIQGIIYPSSRHRGEKACVLFWNHSQCLKNLSLIKLETKQVNEAARLQE